MYKINLFLLALLLTIGSCSVRQNNAKDNANHAVSIQDIWVLIEIQREAISENDFNKIPNLEINLSENKINGNDGCNSYFGDITKINHNEISFGNMGRSEMYCDKMVSTDEFNNLLNKVRRYERVKIMLHLKDSKGKTLLSFKKVD